jgi:hypothetical protein
MTLVSTTITDRTRAAPRQTQPAAARDRRRRAAQSADGSPRPGSAPAGRYRPRRLRSGLTVLRLPSIGHAARRAQSLFNSRIDIADRQRRHSGSRTSTLSLYAMQAPATSAARIGPTTSHEACACGARASHRASRNPPRPTPAAPRHRSRCRERPARIAPDLGPRSQVLMSKGGPRLRLTGFRCDNTAVRERGGQLNGAR